MMDKKRIKKNIGVGSIINSNVGEMEENTREGRIRTTRKEVVGCVQDVVEENNLSFKF